VPRRITRLFERVARLARGLIRSITHLSPVLTRRITRLVGRFARLVRGLTR
jgi:hypothetical protein